MARHFAIIAFCLATTTASLAQAGALSNPDDLVQQADRAFREGDFLRAVRLGLAAGNARGSALAAWAELAQGKFVAPTSERMADIRQAEKDARRALALDSQEVDGHLALVVALGLIGRQEGFLAAHFDGLASEARQHIDRALALAPANPWANALLGGWNLEILANGGVIGGDIYGASVEQGMNAYARALALDPDNSQIAYQYAVELLALDNPNHKSMAHRLLAGIVSRPAGDAVDDVVRSRAFSVMSALDAHDDAQVAGLVKDELGGIQ